ncbi:hypothetical protein KZ292_25200, partial [Escherichia coli]|nr:hypothetical protein [Escherichia coli]
GNEGAVWFFQTLSVLLSCVFRRVQASRQSWIHLAGAQRDVRQKMDLEQGLHLYMEDYCPDATLIHLNPLRSSRKS